MLATILVCVCCTFGYSNSSVRFPLNAKFYMYIEVWIVVSLDNFYPLARTLIQGEERIVRNRFLF